ncbi:MAG: hypothetical protein EPN48_18440 [Microbacteriaceae bacterium]|nr:MAG: hypothetical protein EPN48_18440 [Microbacteriaceae bacterium]
MNPTIISVIRWLEGIGLAVFFIVFIAVRALHVDALHDALLPLGISALILLIASMAIRLIQRLSGIYS